MGNHIHLALRVHPESEVTTTRCANASMPSEAAHWSDVDLEAYRKRLCSLSEFMRMFKQSFGRYYNKKHRRKGYFWGDRYKNVIFQEGETLVNLLAYIDLNPVRARERCQVLFSVYHGKPKGKAVHLVDLIDLPHPDLAGYVPALPQSQEHPAITGNIHPDTAPSGANAR